MIATFQAPNKYFAKDDQEIDADGKDWEATWGHVLSK